MALDRPLSFRTGTRADIEILLELIHSGYRGEESRHGWTTEADFLDGQRTDRAELETIIAANSASLLLSELGGHLVGCCHLERHDEFAYFGMFAVRPQMQRHGLGSKILEEAERIAQELWGSKQMRMRVIAQRLELIPWYERRGYRLTGEIVPFPYGNPRLGLPKRPDLEFVVLLKDLS